MEPTRLLQHPGLFKWGAGLHVKSFNVQGPPTTAYKLKPSVGLIGALNKQDVQY